MPDEEVAAVTAAHDAVRRDAGLAAWVAAAAGSLAEVTGEPSPGPALRPSPTTAAGGDVTAYLPVVVLAAVLPALLAEHERRGVPAQVTAETLSDVGRMLTRNRVWFGEPGLGDELTRWLTRHLQGAVVQLGRLQYERRRLAEGPGVELGLAGFPCGPGDLVLDLHVPGVGGPLVPAAVDASLAAARTFFRRRYPEERYAGVVCHSWLLDPRLATVLPEGSNLVAFARRFTVGGEPGDGDLSVRKFVWGDLTTARGDLPRDSTLRAGVLDLWASGGHWQDRRGWLPWR